MAYEENQRGTTERLVCVCGQSCEGVRKKKKRRTESKERVLPQNSTLFIQHSVEGVTLHSCGMDQVGCSTFEWLSSVASANSDIVARLFFRLQHDSKRDFKRTSGFFSPPPLVPHLIVPLCLWLIFPWFDMQLSDSVRSLRTIFGCVLLSVSHLVVYKMTDMTAVSSVMPASSEQPSAVDILKQYFWLKLSSLYSILTWIENSVGLFSFDSIFPLFVRWKVLTGFKGYRKRSTTCHSMHHLCPTDELLIQWCS